MPRKSPLVSVIMPVFNSAPYVSAAVESILHQTFSDFELIVINDGSTDGSHEILNTYRSRDERILFRNHEQNRGLVAVLNDGLQLASGAFIARMDSDDISHPDRLTRQVEFLMQNPEVGVVGTQMNILDAAGSRVGIFETPTEHNRIIWSLLFGRSFAHPSIMMRKSLFEKTSGYNSDFPVTEDQELWMRMVWLTQFANLPQTLVDYRSHPEAVSRRHAELQRDQILTLRRRLVSQILDRDVSVETLEFLRQSQIPASGISQEAVRNVVVPFLLELFEGFKRKALFIGEVEKVHADLVDKIVRASQSAMEKPAVRQNTVVVTKPTSHWKEIIAGLKQNLGFPTAWKDQGEKQNAARDESIVNHARQNGISVVVLSFERLISLPLMLESLYAQDLEGLQIELIICNNSSQVQLKQTPFTALGRALSKFSDIKILNGNYNWQTAIRYALATLAKYETVLFLDDDLILRDRKFISYMFENFKKLEPVDILSCWNRLWVEWTNGSIKAVSLTFRKPNITRLTMCDVAGPGICMFNKRILTPVVLEGVMAPEFPRADDMGFSLLASIEHNSNCYYLPSHQMLEFHEEGRKAALALTAPSDRSGDMIAMFNSLLEKGYRPVLSRLSNTARNSSPELQAVALLSGKTPSGEAL